MKDLGLPSLEYRRLRADVIEVFKIINRIDVVNVDKFFTFAEYARMSGHSYNYSVKIESLGKANVFLNRVADVWNSLSETVVTVPLPSLNTFKSRLQKYWHRHNLKFNPSCNIAGQPTEWRQPYEKGSIEAAGGLEGPLQ